MRQEKTWKLLKFSLYLHNSEQKLSLYIWWRLKRAELTEIFGVEGGNLNNFQLNFQRNFLFFPHQRKKLWSVIYHRSYSWSPLWTFNALENLHLSSHSVINRSFYFTLESHTLGSKFKTISIQMVFKKFLTRFFRACTKAENVEGKFACFCISWSCHVYNIIFHFTTW